MYIADSHIDGTLMPLKEGVFLVNEQFLNTNYIKNHQKNLKIKLSMLRINT